MLAELLTEFNSQLSLLGKDYYGVITEKHGGITVNRYQYKHAEVITATDHPQEHNIGQKRNLLLDLMLGKYFAFFDDDDLPGEEYFKMLFLCLKEHKNLDCCSLRGMMTKNGSNPEIFEHSIKYTEYSTKKGKAIVYERYPNHLNLILAEHGKKFRFPPTNHGEDTAWATQLFKSGLLKREAYIDKVIYYYRWIPKPRI